MPYIGIVTPSGFLAFSNKTNTYTHTCVSMSVNVYMKCSNIQINN